MWLDARALFATSASLYYGADIQLKQDSAMTNVADRAIPWEVEELQSLLAAPAKPEPTFIMSPPGGGALIGFGGGVPDAPTFPVAQIEEAVRTVLRREPAPALEYLAGGPIGVPELRQTIIDRIEPEQGVALGIENVTVTSGAAAALDNVFRTFLDPGDVMLVEAPTYMGAVRNARATGCRFVSVPMDGDGLNVDALETTLADLTRRGQRAKLLYTIPTFQNPGGTTLPLARRERLLEICARYKVLVFEDDAYGDLRFTDEILPSLFTLAQGRGVLRTGTISKTIAPGLRVGWIKGQKPLIDALVRMRFDNGSSPFVQRVVNAYVAAGSFEPHVAKMRGVYKAKYQTMDAALGEHLARYATWTEPKGGFFVWVKLPGGVDCLDLQKRGWDAGIAFVPGTACFTDGSGRDHIRLAYSSVNHDEIRDGIARLGRIIDEARAAQ
jgi:2-aminoadipate transaminase